MNYQTIILYIVLSLLQSILGADQWSLYENDPGIVTRLTPSGVAYLQELGMKAVNKQVPNTKWDVPLTSELPENLGTVTTSNITVAKYWPPTSNKMELLPPNGLRWTMRGFGIKAVGKYSAKINLLTGLLGGLLNAGKKAVTGDFEALARPMDYILEIRIGLTKDGYPTLTASQCTTTMRAFDVKIKNDNPLLAMFIDGVKGMVNDEVKPVLEGTICAQSVDLVNTKGNAMITALPLLVPLGDESANKKSKSKPPSRNNAPDFHMNGADVSELIDQIRNPNMILDLRMLKAPIIAENPDSIELWHSGEISWQNEGGTPFTPMFMPTLPSKNMVQISISEFVTNSMFYHGHWRRLFDFHIRSDTAPKEGDLDSILTTSCDGVCFGDLMYGVAEKYPDMLVDMQFYTLETPTVKFRENVTDVNIVLLNEMFVRKAGTTKQTKVIESEVYLNGRMRFGFQKDTIKSPDGSTKDVWKLIGGMKIDNFRLQLVKDASDETADQDQLDTVAVVMESLFNNMLNQALTTGIEFPPPAGVQISNPTLGVHPRYMTLDADISIDDVFVGAIAL